MSTTPDTLTDNQAVLERYAQQLTIAAGTRLFSEGDPCEQYVLVRSGTAVVQKLTASGQEMVLYKIEAGESCILTTSCLIAHEHYPADGYAETDLQVWLLSRKDFHLAMDESAGFRSDVLSAFGHRVSDLIQLVQSLAFGDINQRLARYLLNHQRDSGIAVTHQKIASALGTAREVVSRHLKDWERGGLLQLERGHIHVREAKKLAEKARRTR